MLEYARSLEKLGHDVTVYTTNALSFRPSNLPSNEVKDKVRIIRFRFIPLPMKYSFLSIGLFRALLTTDADVLEVFSILPSFFILGAILVAKLRRIPLILYPQFHPNRFDYHPNRWVRVIGRIFDRAMAVYFIGLADHVICLTKLEERFYHTKGITKTTTIYEWVPRRLMPDRKTVDEFRSRLQISEKDQVVLFVGRVDKRKGLDILVRALPSVIKKVPNTRLVVVGRDDGHLEECVNLARTLNCEDKIAITGQLPAVLTDHVALSEVATPGSGLVIRVGSVQELADSLVSLLNDKELRERLGERGFKTLGERMLELSDVMDMTLDIYKHAIENRAQ